MSNDTACSFRWLATGESVLAEMLAAIDRARVSVRLEMYIFQAGGVGDRFRDALVRACQRGVQVQVLVDAFGSFELSEHYWDDLRRHGGEFRWFNPISLRRIGFRDHRKLLICDDREAVVGGTNVGEDYCGDGVTRGWRDLGLAVCGALVRELAVAFDEMYVAAGVKPRPFLRFRRARELKTLAGAGARLLLSAPGRRINPFRNALRDDIRRARRVQIASAYFLPTWFLRRELGRVVKRGGQVQLILAGKSDVRITQLAAQSLYRRMLRAGLEIHEYQPQVLHTKLFIMDDVVYVGSANLDLRSFYMNYELLVRLEDPLLATEARRLFDHDLRHCRRIEPEAWRQSRTFWDQIKGRIAHFILVRDPHFFRHKLKAHV